MLVFGKRGADFGLSDAHGAAFAALLPPAVRTEVKCCRLPRRRTVHI